MAQEWYADGLKFSCTQCGNCCSGPPGYVWFTDEEAEAMAESLQLDVPTFLRRFAHTVNGNWTLNENVNPQGKGYDCTFLRRDDQGKALKTPLYNLIGGLCQPRIPLEWSVSMADDVATMIAESKRAVDEFGIRVLCLKMADRRGWRRDVENFAAVRKAVGDDIMIGIDPNTGWTLADALSAIHEIRKMDLGYIEQPIERRDLKGMAEIRRAAGGVPVMAD